MTATAPRSSRATFPGLDQSELAQHRDHTGSTSSLAPDPKALDPQAYVFTQQAGHLLRRAYQTHLSIFQQNAYDPQLTSVQFVVLCALLDNGPSSQAELVKATKIDQATIRGIVQRLKARALIGLTDDQDDRRKVIMSLTPAGEELLTLMIPSARTITELTLARLNPAERVALYFLLRKLIDPADE